MQGMKEQSKEAFVDIGEGPEMEGFRVCHQYLNLTLSSI